MPSETIRNDMRTTGRLMRGNQVYDVSLTAAKTGHGWKWRPRDMRIPLDALKDCYDAPTWDVFERTARSAQVKGPGTGSTRSLWDWLGGKDAPGAMSAATIVQAPKTPDELLTRRGYTADDAARVLNDHPNYEESVIMRRWARDREGQRDIAWGNSPQQQHQRAVFSSIIDRIEPFRSEDPVYRGFNADTNRPVILSRFHMPCTQATRTKKRLPSPTDALDYWAGTRSSFSAGISAGWHPL